MIKYISYLFAAMLIIFGIYSCNNSSTFSMGQELLDVKTDIVSADTFTIRGYTIKADSFVTSGTGKALVGSYFDNDLGLVKASSYFYMNTPPKELSKSASFVSLTLCMHYSRYIYGDTTKPYKIAAYRLTQKLDDMKRESSNSIGYFYNTSKIDYSEKLGEVEIIPSPIKHDSIDIRLSDDFGNDLLTQIQAWGTNVQNITDFTTYFKGFAIVPDNNNSSILGYNAADTSIYLRLNYNNGGKVDSTLRIKMFVDSKISNLQFNHIECDLSSTKLNSLLKLEDKVPSSATNNQMYCQAGTNIMTRLEFPYIKTLLEYPNIKILKAYLILTPVKNSYNSFSLPSSLHLYELDNYNTNGGSLVNSKGVALTPNLNIDYEYNENTNYTFDVTSYISSLIQLTTPNLPAIGIATSTDLSNTTLDRVIFNDGQRGLNASKLKILYWRY